MRRKPLTTGLVLLAMLCGSGVCFAGAPKVVWGVAAARQGRFPGSADLSFSAYLVARPTEVLTNTQGAYSDATGQWVVQVGSLKTDWRVGDVLRVEFTDASAPGGPATSSVDVTLDGAGSQMAKAATASPAEDVQVSRTSEAFAVLRWRSTSAASYLIEIGTLPPQSVKWSPARTVEVGPTAQTPGSQEEARIGGLAPGASYWVAVRCKDADGRISARSDVVTAHTMVGFVDEDLDLSDPFIQLDQDSLPVADNDGSLTFRWGSWAPLGAASYEVRVRLHDPDQIEKTEICTGTSLAVQAQPNKAYSVEVTPLSASGERLAVLQSRQVLCAAAALESPARPRLSSSKWSP